MNGEQFLDKFFSHPRIALDQPQQQQQQHQQQQQSYVQQPHTPSNRVATESSTAMNTNASSHEGENDPSHFHSGGEAVADSLFINDKHNKPMPSVIPEIQNNIHSKMNGNYADPNSRFSPAMNNLYSGGLLSQQQQQQKHHQHQHHQQHMPKDAMPLHENGLLSDVHLQQLAACLSECKVMATHFLQIAQVSPSPASPVLALLQPIVSHLDTDLNQLITLRSTLLTTAVTNRAMNGDYHSAAANAESRDAILSQPMMSTPTKKQKHQQHHQHHQHQHHQHQQQQHHQEYHQEYHQAYAEGKGSSAAGGEPAALYSQTAIWCTPESRGRPAAEVDSNQAAAAPSLPPFHAPPIQSQTQTQTQPQFNALQLQTQPPHSSFDTAEEGGEDDDSSFVGDVSQGRQGHNSAAALPPVLTAEPTNWNKAKCLAFVEFKRKRVRKYECDEAIMPGTFVMVDGDRGKDCGLIVQTIKTEPDGTTVISCMDCAHVNADKIKMEKGRVLGVASNEEIDHLHNAIPFAERLALETCKKMCINMGITIQLLDCEYQFDMEKVSFYFNSEHSVDFRPLVRELYRTFHVRIWMENTNPNVKNAMPICDSSAVGNGGAYNNNNNGDEIRCDGASSSGYNYNHSHKKHAGTNGGRDGANASRNSAGGRGGGRGRRNRNKA